LNKELTPPNVSPLVYDYLYSYGKVDEFYNGNFRDLAAFQHQIEKVKSRDLPREAVAAILKEQNQNYGCGPQTLGNIDKLMQGQAGAVVTGQQVGLFSGPLYTIYKALTAVKLAGHLNQNCEGYLVPIFWLASDDHDFEEINHITLLNKNNQIEEVRYPSPASSLKTPASKIVLTSEIQNCIQRLKDLTPDSEFKPEILSHLSDAYRPGRSFAEAFAQWLTRLFKGSGLIFIDASHPGLKELGKGIFYQEIAGDSSSTRQALETSGQLRQAGYDSQIPLHQGILNIFFAETERQTIESQDGAYSIKGTRSIYKRDELLALLEKKPQVFSPNVLLRPIYQDTLLPTVAYVGGTAEIAYFAQLKGVYEIFGLPMPVIYPRKSITLIEKKIERVLKNYGLWVQDIWQNADGIINEIARKQVPESTAEVLRAARSHLEQDFKAITREMIAVEPTLEKSVEASLGKIDQQLKFLEKKILQASRKRNNIVSQQLNKAKNHLYPVNHLQERVFNMTPLLIKYSYACIDRLDQAMDLDDHGHQIIKL
jgi:bacillithiol biosynthesis cysteine-adding enzyme BshC